MDNNVVRLYTYKEVLKKIENAENHLLIANGFNYGLGVHTGYSDIFKRMIKDNYGIYAQAIPLIKECDYDLELFLGKIESDIKTDNIFLRKYTKNKIKQDFMQALHQIVKEKLNSIYQEKNEGIYILLRNFTNYFSLNYDAFLYLLLLKYKPNQATNNTIAFEQSLPFIEADLDLKQDNIYTEIKEAREKGNLIIQIGDDSNSTTGKLSLTPKTQFIAIVKAYAGQRNKQWKEESIKKAVDKILEEEKKNLVLSHIDDGSRQKLYLGNEFIFDVNSITQNLFFLHGAFHIIKEGHTIKKITQSSDKALYDKLEEVLNDDNKEIVCIFQSDNKLEAIQNNEYLMHCYNKLAELKGNIVIIGSSLSDNDEHIFNQINKSSIQNIYISTLEKEKDKIWNKAIMEFTDKNIYLFDADTISYEIPEQIENVEN